MAAPTLTDYQYQYGDSGFLINGGASLPFIDVDKVTGLDTPSIEVKDIDYDSQHGGYVYVILFHLEQLLLTALYTPIQQLLILHYRHSEITLFLH